MAGLEAGEIAGSGEIEGQAASGMPAPCPVGFYHLTRLSLEDALPALLEKTLEARERAVVFCSSVAERDRLDKILWESRSSVFLPHGCAKGRGGTMRGKNIPASNKAIDDHEGEAVGEGTEIADDVFAERQPVWLTAGEDVPNQARFLFRLNGAGCPAFGLFTRVFDLFDGRDGQSLTQARLRWKELKQNGHPVTYWKQESRGWRQAG